MRFGRGLDNRRFKATGFTYGFTSRETVQRLGEHLRLHPVMRGIEHEYTYEREVEEFLRWSPHVRHEDSDEPQRGRRGRPRDPRLLKYRLRIVAPATIFGLDCSYTRSSSVGRKFQISLAVVTLFAMLALAVGAYAWDSSKSRPDRRRHHDRRHRCRRHEHRSGPQGGQPAAGRSDRQADHGQVRGHPLRPQSRQARDQRRRQVDGRPRARRQPGRAACRHAFGATSAAARSTSRSTRASPTTRRRRRLRRQDRRRMSTAIRSTPPSTRRPTRSTRSPASHGITLDEAEARAARSSTLSRIPRGA